MMPKTFATRRNWQILVSDESERQHETTYNALLLQSVREIGEREETNSPEDVDWDGKIVRLERIVAHRSKDRR